MHFTKSLLVGAAAVVAVIAQSSPIAFTSTPASVEAGRSVVLRWGGGDDSQPVTITLKRGDTDNLQTVSLITGSATGTSYTWTVPSSLPNGNDYALQINQGVDDVNYSGRFSLTGGSTASSSTSSSSSATSAGTTATSALTSASAIIQSAINSQNGSATTTVAAGNATTTLGGAFGTGAVGTGAVGTGASGAMTGTAIPRNTTMSMATLRSTSTSAAVTTSEASATTGGSEDSSASSSSTGAPSSGAMSAANFASPLVFLLSAVAAIVYLG
ncbi:MAG: hypothetical protein Q9216_000998 [Gyalolechia sp. 2 TL-2023]